MSTGADQSDCSPFVAELVRLRQDPRIVRLACRWAGSMELAEDGLQEAFYRLASLPDAGHIRSVRAYFREALYHEINKQRSALLPMDAESLAEQADLRSTLSPRAQWDDVAELACWRLSCEQRLSKFRQLRHQLTAVIPASSPDPVRYRALILAVAHRLLAEAFYGVSTRELNADLRAGCPEWFDEAGIAAGTLHKRISRARHDLAAVFRTIDGG
jgi:DNA-directed RNA polymerase specialized sigma24 family protein